MWGGVRSIAARSAAGVSPERTAAVIPGRQPHLLRQPADLAPGLGQVAVDVGAQRLERGDVEDPGLLRQRAGQALAQQQIELDEERREGLAGAGGGGDQGVAAGADRVPALPLGAGRLAQPLGEPAGDSGMEVGKRHAEIYALRAAEMPWP